MQPPLARNAIPTASQNELTSSSSQLEAWATLPEDPGSRQNAATFSRSGSAATAPLAPLEASHTDKYIDTGQTAPVLSSKDKVLLGLKDAVSPFSAIGWLASAGYEQALNGSPNYGTDRGAFGQRLGAAALRDMSEGIFSDSIMSPILHEDPRYYRLGPAHNFFARLIYAGTRPILTRTDGGHMSPNLALLAGNVAGAALTQAYYPPLNRGATQVMETFGGSIGGSALGDVVSEFYQDFTAIFRIQRK